MSIKNISVKVCDHCGEQLSQRSKYISIDSRMYDGSSCTLIVIEDFGDTEKEIANLSANMDFCGPVCFIHWIEEKLKDW